VNGRGERRVIDAGDSALLLLVGSRKTASQSGAFDVSVNREAVAIAGAVRSAGLAGVQDVISTYRSVAVFFDPLEADVEQIRSTLLSCAPEEIAGGAARQIDVPVVYGGEWGPDLDDVAAFAGCDRDTVIERHAARSYRVFMLGFLPGYPYMAPVDPSIAMPRRSTPRVSIPAGSVGIAGQQAGIYPAASPGGWQIIGWTPLSLFNPNRTPPALFAPGDEVRFVRAGSDVAYGFSRTLVRLKADTTTRCSVTVVQPGLMTTVQDRGRWGYQHIGVPPAGPLDPAAHDRANVLVGNTRAAATLEATLVGPELRFERPVRFATTGADLSPEVDGIPVRHETATDCAAGSILRFGARKSGGRAYVGFAGGIDVPAALGSRATHVQSGMGGIDGRMLQAGDTLIVGELDKAGRPTPHAPWPTARLHGGAKLRVMRGPQADLFDDASFAELQQSRFIISPQSNRMGYRLTGTRIPAASSGDMLSDATFTGAVQVPPSGDPILLMADRQTTGGYPQMAVVIAADIPVAGQLLPGDWIEFELCTRADAITALRRARRADGAD
jgi:KipI family sensor histidine kinase inhibitor